MDDSLFFSLLAFGEKIFQEIRLEVFAWVEFFDEFFRAIGF